MKPLALLPVASLCSALVVPGQDVLLDVFSKDPLAMEKAAYTRILSGANQVQTNKSPWTSLLPEQSDEPLIQSAIALGLGRLSPIFQIQDEDPFPDPTPGPGPTPIPTPGPSPGPSPPERPSPPGEPRLPLPPKNPHDGEPHRGHCPGDVLCPGSNSLWELISQGRRTARLAELMRDDDELIDLLNGTKNYTVFAPTNRALDHPIGQLELPSMSDILRYHVVPGRLSLEELRAYIHQTLPTIPNGTKKSFDAKKKKKGDEHKHKDKDKNKNKDLPLRLRVDALLNSILINGASVIVTGNIVRDSLPLQSPSNLSRWPKTA